MVPLNEEFVGRFNATSLLPQYLMTAMLTGAIQVTVTASADMHQQEMTFAPAGSIDDDKNNNAIT